MTTPHLHRHDHRRRVDLQQRVHEARRLLLEAAEQLIDLDEALRRGEGERAARAQQQAGALVAASGHQLRRLSARLEAEVSGASTRLAVPEPDLV